MESCIYYTVRDVIGATWLNNKDHYVYPRATLEADEIFKTDCLTYALFNNEISSEHGINHWIPFTEREVGARGIFESHFMTDYTSGKLWSTASFMPDLKLLVAENMKPKVPREPLKFSEEALAVFGAGKELWRFYHGKDGSNPNASLYDIKKCFQGLNAVGRMNSKSGDEKYNNLIGDLKDKRKILAAKIEPKVYEHGFLLK